MFSEVIKDANDIIRENIKDNKVIEMFHVCFEDTLLKTVKWLDDGTVFMVTGDIPAMWLRDSSCQLRPYLNFLGKSENLDSMVEGVIHRQFSYIIEDPYANAFNETANGNRWDDDIPLQDPIVWERKYEIDSLCYPFQLAYQYWKYTGKTNIFTDKFREVATTVISLWKVEQNHHKFSTYRFQRPGRKMLINNGSGSPVGYTGMTWSGFRPSDDACKYHYLIPSNLFAIRVLDIISTISEEVLKDPILKKAADNLRGEITLGVNTYGILENGDGQKMYAYEVNGLGDHLLMDDSNMPSLLSLPMLTNISKDDEIYLNTRKFILSNNNPFYYEGARAVGVGSPHTPAGNVWPIAIAVEGITDVCMDKKWEKIKLISNNDANTNQVHESFNPNNPFEYTREWFSWGNAMFCELVLNYCGYEVIH
ncbi:glycoside hydrolase family 125 protein [Oceanobacillus salinisoli]|uniref:glycoside hydrolase family 125 protein n=1 Tax=Oceanobacillus salinisoli TaxID=2678611 RepID=UPI0012E233A9|nr:glycoside hydrolase family 125 protein [Oceanobacillus salinisoli]